MNVECLRWLQIQTLISFGLPMPQQTWWLAGVSNQVESVSRFCCNENVGLQFQQFLCHHQVMAFFKYSFDLPVRFTLDTSYLLMFFPCFVGEELHITYIDASMAPDERQSFLKQHYGFTCNCARCREGDWRVLFDANWQISYEYVPYLVSIESTFWRTQL